ncbi:hypothetical protein VitviT2T_027496 [Vitis vinifera]|uniref:Uncharacterized protein n=1 Tax=Vitis vinifera TaxID=29760 RepID=A0ABY9DU15_VITVI|nr:hypothetical protein VitviT2T_027496 [Vitis vinifera]
MEEDEEQGNSKEKEKPLDDHIDTKVYEDKVNIGHEENGTCEVWASSTLGRLSSTGKMLCTISKMADIRYGFLWGSFDMGVRKRRTSMQMKIGPRSVPCIPQQRHTGNIVYASSWSIVSLISQPEIEVDTGLKTMEISPSSTCLPCEIPSCDVKVLEGLTSEVFACAWSPAGSFLASGSGDSTARIWSITNGPCSTMQNGLLNIVLKHFRGRTNEKNKDVTTLDWNGDGTVLATGSYDNQARIWSRVGMLF